MAGSRPCPACGAGLAAGFTKDSLAYGLCPAGDGAFAEVPPGGDSYDDYLPALTRVLPEATRRRYRELLASFGPYRRGGRLLDVGCGGGFFVREAAAAGFSAEGTEVSAAAAEFARGMGVRVHLGTLASSGLAPGAFDVVTLFEVVEHLATPAALVAEAAALLRPGGLLYLTTPNYGSLSRRLLGARWSLISRQHPSLFAARGLAALCRRAGLEPVRIGSRNILPHEIAGAFRRRRGGPPPASRMPRTVALQAFLEERPALRAGKRLLNLVLSAGGLGDTLILRALRRR